MCLLSNIDSTIFILIRPCAYWPNRPLRQLCMFAVDTYWYFFFLKYPIIFSPFCLCKKNVLSPNRGAFYPSNNLPHELWCLDGRRSSPRTKNRSPHCVLHLFVWLNLKLCTTISPLCASVAIDSEQHRTFFKELHRMFVYRKR